MDTKNISNLLIKVSGIVIIATIIVGLPSYINYYAEAAVKTLRFFVSSVVVPNILPIIVGIWLFIYPDKITNKLVVENDNSKSNYSVDMAQVEIVALTVLGFFMLFKSLSDFVFNLSNWSHAKYILLIGKYGDQNVNKEWIYSNLISTLIELIFSLWLILKSKGIVNFLNHLRSGNR